MKTETDESSIQIWLELPLTLEKTWTLLTEQRHLDTWWKGVRLETHIGGKFIEKWSNGEREVVTFGKVLRYDPPNLLILTWADDDWTQSTQVIFQLTEHDKTTHLNLKHTDWHIHQQPERSKLIADHAEGWSQNLESLKTYASTL